MELIKTETIIKYRLTLDRKELDLIKRALVEISHGSAYIPNGSWFRSEEQRQVRKMLEELHKC